MRLFWHSTCLPIHVFRDKIFITSLIIANVFVVDQV